VPVNPPTRPELDRLAKSFHLDLHPDELDAISELAGAVLGGFRRLDEYADETLEVKYPRDGAGYRPLGDDNPSNGWAWKCSVKGAQDGPLAGKKAGLKDNISLAGIPMLNGTPMMEGFVPRNDATVVTRLLDAGAEIVGKSAVPGYCLDAAGFTGYPDPQPTNPHNPAYAAGASSNGSAVVVATGEADFALGGDQGGSIRMPSSWTGTCGHKPTHGLVPYTGIFPIELSIDHVGPMARTVADCAEVLAVIAGEDGLDSRQVNVVTQDYVAELDKGLDGLRIGVLAEGFGWENASEEDVDAAVRSAADALAGAGAHVEEVSVPMHRDGLVIWNAVAIEGATDIMVRGDGVGTNHKGFYQTELADFYGRARRTRADDYPIGVKLAMIMGAYLSERYNHHYYAKGQNLGRRLKGLYDEALEGFDVLVMPTTAMKAQPIPENPTIAENVALTLGCLHNTAIFDVTGNPALSVPCSMSDGLPTGIQFVGRHFDDATVLRAGHAFEQVRGPLT
jgi:amidase